MFSQRFIFIIISTIIITLIFPGKIDKKEKEENSPFPIYRVVLDPGHGGLSLEPKDIHGDRYDSISGKYISYYQEGTQYAKIRESVITYEIAVKVKRILDLTTDDEGFAEFKKIISKYSKAEPQRVILSAYLSRNETLTEKDKDNEDLNGNYRLFDYVYNGKKMPGRITRINNLKPHLVVSLHCDLIAPVYFRGINPVIAPPNSFLVKGLEYLRGKTNDRNFFFRSPYSDWFAESVKRSGFKWFLNDTFEYFAGYSLDSALNVRKNRFVGYRQNMVTWEYSDAPGWEKRAAGHADGSRYSGTINGISPDGRFWERERSVYEKYRRDDGFEGFGGDNMYASSEVIRYILYSLDNIGRRKDYNLGKSYISVWSLPIFVNAVTAFIELGYLKRSKDRYLLTKRQDEVAEGIAVGIYSLFTGIKPEKNTIKDAPRGQEIDFKKYILPSGESYFDIVAP